MIAEMKRVERLREARHKEAEQEKQHQDQLDRIESMLKNLCRYHNLHVPDDSEAEVLELG